MPSRVVRWFGIVKTCVQACTGGGGADADIESSPVSDTPHKYSLLMRLINYFSRQKVSETGDDSIFNTRAPTRTL